VREYAHNSTFLKMHITGELTKKNDVLGQKARAHTNLFYISKNISEEKVFVIKWYNLDFLRYRV